MCCGVRHFYVDFLFLELVARKKEKKVSPSMDIISEKNSVIVPCSTHQFSKKMCFFLLLLLLKIMILWNTFQTMYSFFLLHENQFHSHERPTFFVLFTICSKRKFFVVTIVISSFCHFSMVFFVSHYKFFLCRHTKLMYAFSFLLEFRAKKKLHDKLCV